MMRKGLGYGVMVWMIITFIAMLFIALAPDPGGAQEPGARVVKIPEKVLVTVPEGTNMTKEQAAFPHQTHSSHDCTVCHHKVFETLTVGNCSMEGCHANTATKSGTDSFYAAFHAKAETVSRSCVDCHRQTKTEGNPSGPTICNDCHSKE
ncbi:MAG: cytochrome c3 family protein [bacterium]